MSANDKDLYFQNKLINRHVGGYDKPYLQTETEYMKDQLAVLRQNNQELPPQSRYFQPEKQYMQERYIPTTGLQQNPVSSFPSLNPNYQNQTIQEMTQGKDVYLREDYDRYDPYVGYRYRNGLLSDGYQKRTYQSYFIDVNSANRNKLPTLITDDNILLEANPLIFTNGSNTIFIKHPNSGFDINTPITIDGVVSTFVTLRTYRGTNLPTFEIIENCNFMKIYYTHNIPLSYTGKTITVTINGIKGDRGTQDTSSFLGSIPTNILNTTHQVYLTLTDNDIACSTQTVQNAKNDQNYFTPNSNYFFVILPVSLQPESNGPPYTLNDYNFKLKFNSLAGVPLNQINARYPIDPTHLSGYHVIKSINSTGYTIQVPTNSILSNTSFTGGGQYVYVSRVLEINPGYPDPNQYRVSLGSSIHNVVIIRLVSSEIPNTEKAIKDTPPDKANNKIYWNDIDDGDYLYSISIPPGNYSPADLINAISTAFANTPRVNAMTDAQRQALGITYTSRHFVQVSINQNTNEIQFQPYKEFLLQNPIEEITPTIPTNSLEQPVDPSVPFTLLINHPKHGMTSSGQTILIQGAVNDSGIPGTVINGNHIVTEIVDANHYKIQLSNFNLLTDRRQTGGGVNVFIYVPDLMRLRFDQPDTMGGVLGFRNPGQSGSITPYGSIISNKDLYYLEPEVDAFGKPLTLTNNFLQLSGDNYIIMTINQIKTFYTLGSVKNGFAKIILCDSPGKILFNTYVNMYQTYYDPIHEIHNLDISFYSPTGELFDFNGIDHSFTLEIISVNDRPIDTGINSNTGKNYNQDVNEI